MIDELNRRAYNDPVLVGIYSQWSWLQVAEDVILRQLEQAMRGGKVLDLGVGGGRTVGPLMKLSGEYTGIDYSPSMIEAARRRYPSARLLCCDARDMSVFPGRQFDFVFFSFNGIDSTTNSGRLAILCEVVRVLRDGGRFVFSSHNRNSLAFARFRSPFAGFTYRPGNPGFRRSLSRRLTRKVIAFGKHLWNRRHQIHTREYSIINEPTAEYAYFLYYATLPSVVSQLRACGFGGPIQVFDERGSEAGPDSRSSWLHYVATK